MFYAELENELRDFHTLQHLSRRVSACQAGHRILLGRMILANDRPFLISCRRQAGYSAARHKTRAVNNLLLTLELERTVEPSDYENSFDKNVPMELFVIFEGKCAQGADEPHEPA